MTVNYQQSLNLKRAIANDTNAINNLKSNWSQIDEIIPLIVHEVTDNNIQENNVILTIQKLLWNEIPLEKFPWLEDFLLISTYLKEKNYLSFPDFKAIINHLYTQNIHASKDFLNIIFILTPDEKISSFNTWQQTVLDWTEDMGSIFIELRDVIEYFEFSGLKVDNKWHNLAIISGYWVTRREFILEVLENSDSNELESLTPWIPWDDRKKVIDYLVKREVTGIDKTLTWESTKSAFSNSTSILNKFPPSFNVLGDRIAELPATPLAMDVFEKLPRNLLNDWAPKFSYSHPEPQQKIEIYFPGGRHIGHSAILIKTSEGMVLLDFGMSVVNNSLPRWFPLLEKIDAVLLTHAHSDHSGGLPLLTRVKADIPWFARYETKMMSEMLWFNTASILKRNYHHEILKKNPVLKNLIRKKNIINTLANFNEIKPGETLSILPNLEVKTHGAAHIFGSVGYELIIGGKSILYTGDFNGDGTKIFKGAKFPTDIDVIIFDGTNFNRYKNTNQPSVNMNLILKNSKRILIPAFSLGRSQEMIYHLKKLGADRKWKIYITGMGGKIAEKLNVIASVNKNGKRSGFEIVPYIPEEKFVENTIVIAGQGMLQSGGSRVLLDATAEDPETSVVICGYQAPNTLGAHLLNKHPYLIKKYKQNIVKVNMSGHTSGKTLDRFIDRIGGKKVLVHAPEGSYEQQSKLDNLLRPEKLKSISI